MTNIMRKIRIEKVTLNIGAGNDPAKLEKGMKLIEMIAGIKPIKTVTMKRIPSWGVRPNLPIGCKLTLRKEQATEVLKRILTARDNKLEPRHFDSFGNINFGMVEYIYIPGVKYDPAIGVMGFEVMVTLERPGFRIRRRKQITRKIPSSHQITPEEAIEFMKHEFHVEVAEE